MSSFNTRFHGLLKIVAMSGQCVICQVNVPGLGYNWTTFCTLAAVTTGWGPIQHIFSWTIKVADNWLNILWFFCVWTLALLCLAEEYFKPWNCVFQWEGYDASNLGTLFLFPVGEIRKLSDQATPPGKSHPEYHKADVCWLGCVVCFSVERISLHCLC